jgi:hypothetical protein
MRNRAAIAALPLAVGLLALPACGGGGSGDAEPTSTTIPVPGWIADLYDTTGWKVEKDGNSIHVQTSLYMDDEGRQMARGVCWNFLHTMNDQGSVSVEGQNGVEFCP